MQLPKLLAFAAIAHLVVATATTISGTTSTLSTSSYSQGTSDWFVIETDAALVFPSVSNLVTGSNLLIYGDLIVNAQSGATIEIDSVTNYESGEVTITGSGSLDYDNSRTFSNLGTWTMTSTGNMDVDLTNDDYTFTNEGTLEFSTDGTMSFTSAKTIDNSGDLTFSSDGEGTYQFAWIENSGTMLILSDSLSDSMTFGNILTLGTRLTNSGYFVYDYGSSSGNAIALYGQLDNSGIINVYGSSGTNEFYESLAVTNDGSICLRHTWFDQNAAISGTGCWLLADESYIDISFAYSVSTGQSFVLQDTTSYIYVSFSDYRGNTYNLYGVKSGMTFLRSGALIFSSVSYDTSTGVLKAIQSSFYYTLFDIGTGYDESGFTVSDYEITYTGTNPTERELPSDCICAPANSSSSSASSWSSYTSSSFSSSSSSSSEAS